MSVRLRTGAVVLGAAAALLLSSLSLVAQEGTTTTKTEVVAKRKRAADPSRRVPDNFDNIGLTPEQRESIYKVRAKHQAKIADLQKQLAAVRREELAECETVLNDTQKQLLSQLRRAADERRAAAKKAAAEKKAAAKKAAAEAKPAGGQAKPGN